MADTTFQPRLRLAEVAVGRMRSYKVGEREIVCAIRVRACSLSTMSALTRSPA